MYQKNYAFCEFGNGRENISPICKSQDIVQQKSMFDQITPLVPVVS